MVQPNGHTITKAKVANYFKAEQMRSGSGVDAEWWCVG